MFKKKPTVKALAPLRSSDRRKLADQIIKDFALESSAPPTLDTETPEQKADAVSARASLRSSLLPDNCQSARFTTTQGPELKQASGTVYVGRHNGDEARILWFSIDGRIYPSVYTLWRHPGLVPLLHTPDVVVRKLQGGADLMTPGLAGGPPFPEAAKQGAVVAVAATDRPSVPVVVGYCEIDVSALGKVQGAKGHAVKNVHWAGDEAWAFSGGGKAGQRAPEEIEGWVQILEARGLTEQVDSLDLEEQDEEGGVAIGVDEDTRDQANDHGELDDGQDNADADEIKELSQQEVDAAFRNAFIYGLYKHKTDDPDQPHHGLFFPLSQSYIMSALIQPFLPAVSAQQEKQLQIKKTSWKNIKKFVKALDKEGVLKSKEKDGHETIIIDVDFDDAAIVNFKPYPLSAKKEAASSSSSQHKSDGQTSSDVADPSIGQKLQVLNYFKPTPKLQPLFSHATAAPGKAKQQFFLPTEIRQILASYIDAENLTLETNKRLVTLDPTLANAVFDGSSGPLDREVLAKGSVPRDALLDRVRAAMQPYHSIVRVSPSSPSQDGGSAKPRAGPAPLLHLQLETRSGSKTATRISNLEPFHISPRLLADELRRVCAGATAVEPLAGAAKKFEEPVMAVMVQGPQREAVLAALERRGVKAQWVEIVDRTKKGKK